MRHRRFRCCAHQPRLCRHGPPAPLPFPHPRARQGETAAPPPGPSALHHTPGSRPHRPTSTHRCPPDKNRHRPRVPSLPTARPPCATARRRTSTRSAPRRNRRRSQERFQRRPVPALRWQFRAPCPRSPAAPAARASPACGSCRRTETGRDVRPFQSECLPLARGPPERGPRAEERPTTRSKPRRPRWTAAQRRRSKGACAGHIGWQAPR
mmetsp:Transcript_9822/g.38245  ORF Transcript_9822/g.38245 Transcript_9822/m.38245 type:complete len:210 (-) Transcript_9822:924-1553(-)